MTTPKRSNTGTPIQRNPFFLFFRYLHRSLCARTFIQQRQQRFSAGNRASRCFAYTYAENCLTLHHGRAVPGVLTDGFK